MVDEYKYSDGRMTDAEAKEYDRQKNLQRQVDHSGEFDLTDIPEILDHNSFYTAAKLMRKWFVGPANNDIHRGVPSADIVKMEWMLSFYRAKKNL